MPKKLIFSLLLSALLALLIAIPLTLAADLPAVVPLGPAQSEIRAAYRAVFSHTTAGGQKSVL